MGLLDKWNQRINLTSIKDTVQLVTTLFAESFYATTLLGPLDSPILDVGSGAGFPGMAMKLYRPDREMILLEPRKKRSAFLSMVSRELGLSGVNVWTRTLEDCESEDFTHRPAVLTMRAVGHATELIRVALPLLASRRKVLVFVSESQASVFGAGLPRFHWQQVPFPWNPAHLILVGQDCE